MGDHSPGPPAAHAQAMSTLAGPEAMNARLAALLVDVVEEYAIFGLDAAGTVTTWNRGAQRIKGYAATEVIGRHFSVFYSADDVRAGKPDRQLARARMHGSSRDEGWRLRKDGSRFWANVTITAIFDSDGNLDGFAKVTRDDTDRKRIEEQVRELELLNDRERIAHAMHATIARRIFETSSMLAGALSRVHDPEVSRRVMAAIGALDDTLSQIRSLVLDPHDQQG